MGIFSKQIEYIPDEDFIYRGIIYDWYDELADKISSAAFKNYDYSVDWEKYITPEESAKKRPKDHLSKSKAKIPRQKNLEVKHTPLLKNKEHSSVIGKKNESIARFLAKNSDMVIIRS